MTTFQFLNCKYMTLRRAIRAICKSALDTKIPRMARGSNFLTCPGQNHFPLRNTGVPMRPRERH